MPPASSEELGRVRVAVRVRPINANERKDVAVVCADPRRLEVTQTEAGGVTSRKAFDFDWVAHEGFGQTDVFRHCGVQSLLDSASQGMKVTIFAYGATGSGKTHTIIGPESTQPEEELEQLNGDTTGIMERGAGYLFEKLPTLRLVASFYEIYNEQVFDLLDASKTPLRLKHNVGNGFFVPGLVELECLNAEDVGAVVTEGRRSRRRAAHKLNRDSSRGHAILTLRLLSQQGGKVTFVDLAGNERLKRSETGDANETGSINRSLFALGKVISALSNNNSDHIPYRDSTLTKLLMDSLGGDVFTLMIACISPAAAHLDETLCTLQYARRAKGIINAPTVSLNGSKPTSSIDDDTVKELIELRREVASLRAENQRLRAAGPLSVRSALSAPTPRSPRINNPQKPQSEAGDYEPPRSAAYEPPALRAAVARRRRPPPPSAQSSAFISDDRSVVEELKAQLRQLQTNYSQLEANFQQQAASTDNYHQQQAAAWQHQQQQQQWAQALAAQEQQQQHHQWSLQQQHQQQHQYQEEDEEDEGAYPEAQLGSPRDARHDPSVVLSPSRRRNSSAEANGHQQLKSVRYQKTGDIVRRHRDDLTNI